MKGISFLIESELEKAEVVLAAKSITDKIQKMAETVAKMDAEDVMPLADPIREYFGPEAASAFAQAVSAGLRELTEKLSATKTSISDEIARMQGELDGTPQSDLANMDDDALGDAPADDDAGIPSMDDAADASPAPEEAAPEAPAAAAPIPRFDDEDMGSLKAAGRARKESAEPLNKMLEAALNELSSDSLGKFENNKKTPKNTKKCDGVEKAASAPKSYKGPTKVKEGVDPDRIVAQEYAKMIREGKTAMGAASVLTETYGIGIDTLINIVSAYKK